MRCNKNKHFTKDTLSLEKITIKTNLLETREKNWKRNLLKYVFKTLSLIFNFLPIQLFFLNRRQIDINTFKNIKL